ncbi:hypothetical protein ACMX2H_18480 [Arthrobacter sulfonylureivorans]|uniref:hypothetical protein n=1 Tax=Arthrobacter sulfonylureivorans TaxID=2486855 RepID=UPI0039E4B08E
MQSIEARNRSYSVRVQKAGTKLVAVADVVRGAHGVVIREGETVTAIFADDNAGFRGIEVSVKNAEGKAIYNVSTGYFNVAK